MQLLSWRSRHISGRFESLSNEGYSKVEVGYIKVEVKVDLVNCSAHPLALQPYPTPEGAVLSLWRQKQARGQNFRPQKKGTGV